ncbi:MAG: hypothetical protein G01um101466_787, partial [Parcubacteria group bacterium Gr01-1014_66]
TIDSVILHTLFFIAAFLLVFTGITLDTVLLVLTTVVSLEAIYLAIFIQMTVNRNTESLEEVEEDLEEIQEDVKELESDVEDISEDVEELSEDIDKIQEQEEREAITEVDMRRALEKIEGNLQTLLKDIESFKKTEGSG